MKLFNFAIFAAAIVHGFDPRGFDPRKSKIVTQFCGEDLNDFYKTDGSVVTYM